VHFLQLQFVVVLQAAYFTYSAHRTGLPIPYVLPIIGEFSSSCRVLE